MNAQAAGFTRHPAAGAKAVKKTLDELAATLVPRGNKRGPAALGEKVALPEIETITRQPWVRRASSAGSITGVQPRGLRLAWQGRTRRATRAELEEEIFGKHDAGHSVTTTRPVAGRRRAGYRSQSEAEFLLPPAPRTGNVVFVLRLCTHWTDHSIRVHVSHLRPGPPARAHLMRCLPGTSQHDLAYPSASCFSLSSQGSRKPS
jgi:hypothetical protein